MPELTSSEKEEQLLRQIKEARLNRVVYITVPEVPFITSGHTIKKQKPCTQTELSKAIGVTFQQIQKYEKGANGMSATRFLQVCIFFKITPTEFAIQAGVMIQDKITTAVPMAQLTNHAIDVNNDEKEKEKKD